MDRTFVGIGFGPIQSGLFLLEAHKSGKFSRLVVSEVAVEVVDELRRSGGTYTINVAESEGTRTEVVERLEVYNPLEADDRVPLVSAIATAGEIATALPSIEFFGRGSPSPAELLAEGFRRRFERDAPLQTVVYAAENHNHAAEALRHEVRLHLEPVQQELLDQNVQFVNTVIGKMSGVVDDLDQPEYDGLLPLVDSSRRAVLVEEFNRILIEEVRLPGFRRGLDIFDEKPDLLPFEEAKLYGHNAAHALMGYLAHQRGLRYMWEVRQDSLYELVEQAFLVESGGPLCQRHAGKAPLFTRAGWEEYAQDLLRRMTNPFLNDRVDRIIRDARRKLGWDDRLIGTMRIAQQHGVLPRYYALGAAAAVWLLLETLLDELWSDAHPTPEMRRDIVITLSEAFWTNRSSRYSGVP